MLRQVIASVAMGMSVVATGAGAQSSTDPAQGGGVRTIQDALDRLTREKAGAKETAHAMGAIPVGSPATWFSPDDYPPAAVRAARSGRVVVAVGIDSTGAVVTCRTLESSGTDLLDQRTCDLAKERGRFDPARDAKGRPTASEYRLPVRWTLPDGTGLKVVDLDRPSDAESRLEVETSFDADGRLLSCHVLARTGDNTIDPCRTATIGTQGAVRWKRAGTMIGARVVQTMTYRAEALP